MSMAKVVTVNKARKAQGACKRCGTEIVPGMPYRFYTVGFRSNYKHIHCMKNECTPRASERESSKLADVYGAQEDAEEAISAATCLEDITSAMVDCASRVREVAEEYREASTNPNTGAVFNTDAEERADLLASAADELEGFDLSEYEEALEKCETCKGAGKVKCDECRGSGPCQEEDDKCPSCDGEGEVACSDCDGEEHDESAALDNAKDAAISAVNEMEMP